MSLEGLACPDCGGTLVAENGQVHCVKQARSYPILGTIPCLVLDPDHFRAL